MKRWVNHMTETKMKDYILVKDEYGDWCMPPESPELIHSEDPARKTNGEVLSTTVFYSILQLMEKFAQMNGLPADAEEYAALAIKIKDAYNKKFFNPGTAQYDNNTVTANLLSLRLGLVPDGYEDKVFANVVETTENVGKGHVSAGVHTIHIAETGISDGSLAGQDYLSLLMSGQSFLVELVNTDNRHGRTACRIESCRQRSAQTVLTHQPTVRCVERRSLLRRTQVAAIPEARHVELAVRMLVTGLYLFPVVEIHIFQRLECDGNALFAILVHHLADDVQR